jgi:hypothetical protein
VFRNFAAVEMLLAYGAIGCLLVGTVMRRIDHTTASLVLIILVVLTIYAIATPHLGALDRYRYPFMALLTVLGLAHGIRIATLESRRGVRCGEQMRAMPDNSSETSRNGDVEHKSGMALEHPVRSDQRGV